MSNIHDSQLIVKLVNSLSKFVDDNERISLPSFSVKLASAKRAYPEDHTIGMMSTVVDKMADNNKLSISKAEIQDLYEKFYTRNTKFSSVFSEELGKSPDVEQIVSVPTESSVTDIMQKTRDLAIDPVLANALNKAFGGAGLREYSEKTARKAMQACKDKFAMFGLNIKSNVMSGNSKVVVCSADFETPRGTTSVLIPVEVFDNQEVSTPEVFVGNDGSHELLKDHVVAYILSRAGQKLVVRAQEVLDAALMAHGSNSEISDVDLALIKLNSLGEEEMYIGGPQICGVQIESANPNAVVNLPKIEDPEIMAAAKIFDTDLGFANFKFGSKLISQGNEFIQNQLNKCGFNNYNIAVSASDDTSITYSVSLNGGTSAFTVPVKIENNMVFPPNVVICNGSISDFDRQSLSNLVQDVGFDRAAAQSASPLYGVKASELVATVKAAVLDRNYIKAEDALNILSQSDDEKAYDIALNAFTQGLKENNLEQVPEITVSCSKIMRHAHSQYDLCGHTGLPLHKVYVDKHGNCSPTYRQNIDNSSEGGYFMDSKVYL